MTRSFADAATGQPWHPAAVSAVRQALPSCWADPAANHSEGSAARALFDASRVTVANALGVDPDQVVFRRSGSDAAELAVRVAAVEARARAGAGGPLAGRPSVLTTAVERRVLLEALDLEGPVRRLPVDPSARAVVTSSNPTPGCDLFAVQVANLEVGTLQPVPELIRLAGGAGPSGPAVLLDATGAAGLVPIPSGWTTLVADAAGWAGPREAAIVIGPAERMRPVPDSIGLVTVIATAVALDAVTREAPTRIPLLRAMGDRVREVVAALPGVVLIGPGEADRRLPHVVAFLTPELDVLWLQAELDRAGVSVGSGSACADRYGRASHVLAAAGHPTKGNLRICLPWTMTEGQLAHLLTELPAAFDRLRDQMGLGPSIGGNSNAARKRLR